MKTKKEITVNLQHSIHDYTYINAVIMINQFGLIELYSYGELAARVFVSPNGSKPILYKMRPINKDEQKEHVVQFFNQLFGLQYESFEQLYRLFGYKED